jgi:hypothetical protein
VHPTAIHKKGVPAGLTPPAPESGIRTSFPRSELLAMRASPRRSPVGRYHQSQNSRGGSVRVFWVRCMALKRTHKALIGVAILGVLACGLSVIAAALDRVEQRIRVPTMVEARIDGALNSGGAIQLSHHLTGGTVNAQFDRRDSEGWLVFDVDQHASLKYFDHEAREIWISLAPDGFHAQALAWWSAKSSSDLANARDIHGVVRLDAARMPEGDEERVVEYSLDATRWGDPVHLDGKFVFRAKDLTPAAEAPR